MAEAIPAKPVGLPCHCLLSVSAASVLWVAVVFKLISFGTNYLWRR
jgi:hypothetical protein